MLAGGTYDASVLQSESVTAHGRTRHTQEEADVKKPVRSEMVASHDITSWV